ncbi:hypothetical protein FRC11_012004 [Ceratobasidium sp. 423]|nr:hypothetical protein FRC11_012004 [Ceratobasidium sp. 423]
MKVSAVLAVTLLASSASASWFSSEPETPYEYAKWNQAQLEQWLKDHNEKLVVTAKQYYRSYASAVSSFSAAASATASTAVYGDYGYQASKSASSASRSASSVAASGSARVAKALEDSKDYIYSNWTDSELRAYLEKHGVVKTQAQLTREQLLAQMRTAYAAVADPVYNAWGTSYMHQWLVEHGIIKSDYEKNRDKLVEQLQTYYYDTNDAVYSTWTDNQLRDWLIEHNIIKSDAQIKREKLQRLVKDNYLSAKGTAWQGWNDSEMRQWLVDNGYLRSDAQVKRDELVDLMNRKYDNVHGKTADYLTWPDARLRAYLRAHGVDDTQVPATRPGLLHETRIRWVQTTNAVENFLLGIKSTVSGGVSWTEEKLNAILNVLGGHKQTAERKTLVNIDTNEEIPLQRPRGNCSVFKLAEAVLTLMSTPDKATLAHYWDDAADTLAGNQSTPATTPIVPSEPSMLQTILYGAAATVAVFWLGHWISVWRRTRREKAFNLELRRRHGIPDSDTRPFNVAYQAASIAARESARRSLPVESEIQQKQSSLRNVSLSNANIKEGFRPLARSRPPIPQFSGQPLVRVPSGSFNFGYTAPVQQTSSFNSSRAYSQLPNAASANGSWGPRYAAENFRATSVPAVPTVSSRSAFAVAAASGSLRASNTITGTGDRRAWQSSSRPSTLSRTTGNVHQIRSRKRLYLTADEEAEEQAMVPNDKRSRTAAWGADAMIDGDNEPTWAQSHPVDPRPVAESHAPKTGKTKGKRPADDGEGDLRADGKRRQTKSSKHRSKPSDVQGKRGTKRERKEVDTASVLNDVMPVHKRGRAGDVDLSIVKEEELDDEDDPTVSRNPLCGGRRIGQKWTSNGQEYMVGPNGDRLRLVTVKESRKKYFMPADSKHADNFNMVDVFVEKWLTEEQYAKAKADGLLAWQESDNLPSPVKQESPEKVIEGGKENQTEEERPRVTSITLRARTANSVWNTPGQSPLTENDPHTNPFTAPAPPQSPGPRRVKYTIGTVPAAALSASRMMSNWEKQEREAQALKMLRERKAAEAAAKAPPKPTPTPAPALAAVPSISLTPAVSTPVPSTPAPSAPEIKPSPFAFGAPSTTTKPAVPVTSNASTTASASPFGTTPALTGFGSTASAPAPSPFGAAPAAPAPAETKPSNGFAFGSTTSAAPATSAPAPASTNVFGAQPAAKPASTGFSFNTGSSTATAPAAKPAGTFSFGATNPAPTSTGFGSTATGTTSSGFGTGSNTNNTTTTGATSSPFAFGAPKTAAPAPTTSGFGAQPAAPASNGFKFGETNTTMNGTSGTSGTNGTSSGFSFGASATKPTVSIPTTNAFGAPPTATPTTTSTPFAFGAGANANSGANNAAASPATPSKPLFNVGAPTTSPVMGTRQISTSRRVQRAMSKPPQ